MFEIIRQKHRKSIIPENTQSIKNPFPRPNFPDQFIFVTNNACPHSQYDVTRCQTGINFALACNRLVQLLVP